MYSKKYSGKQSLKEKGFAISLDAFFGVVLLVLLFSFIGIGLQTDKTTVSISDKTQKKQLLDDAITAMDNTGFIGQVLVDETAELTNTQAEEIYARLDALLPSSLNAQVTITQYEPVDVLGDVANPDTCRGSMDFEKCFKTPEVVATAGDTIDTSEDVYYASQLFMKRQPYNREAEANNECIIQQDLKEPQEKKDTKLLLQEEDIRIITDISVKNNANETFSDGNPFECYEAGAGDNEIANITLKERGGDRVPVSVILVMDTSESMEAHDVNETTLTLDGEVYNASSCGGGVCNASDCSDFDNWDDEIVTFNMENAITIMDDPPINASSYASYSIYGTSTTTGEGINTACSSVPKRRLETPGGTKYYRYWGNTDVDTAYHEVHLRRAQMEAGDWKFDLWSDVPLTNEYSYARLFSSVINIVPNYTGALAGIGTHNGFDEFGECKDFSGWEQIGTYDIIYPTTYYAYGRMAWQEYTGIECSHPTMLACPPGKTAGAPECIEAGFCHSSSKYCNAGKSTGSAFTYFTPQELGTWTIYGWSDVPINYGSHYWFYLTDQVLHSGTNLPGNGTCGGAACGASNCGDRTDKAVVTTLPVRANTLLSFRIESDFGSDATGNDPYDGVCSIDMYLYDPSETYENHVFCHSNGYCHETCLASSSSPENCRTSQEFGSPPPFIMEGDWIIKVWADDPTAVDVRYYIQRIDAAKSSAKTFLDNAEWEPEDLFGLVSFSDSATLEAGLTNQAEIVKSELDNLIPNGETGLGYGIEEAADELRGADMQRFMVILTDGLTVIPTGNAINYAINAAEDARDNDEITIFVIGFAEASALQGTAYEDALRQIAKDRDFAEYCNDGIRCGKYYFAADADELTELYTLIAQELGADLPETNIIVPIPEGIEIDESTIDIGSNGTINTAQCPDNIPTGTPDGWLEGPCNIVFEGVDLDDTAWSAQFFKLRAPCNGSYCPSNEITFPLKSELAEEDNEVIIEYNETYYNWGNLTETSCDGTACEEDAGNDCASQTTCCNISTCEIRTGFNYSDLNVQFQSGEIGVGDITIDFNIINAGTKNVDLTTPLEISFYINDPEEPLNKIDTVSCQSPASSHFGICPPDIPGACPCSGGTELSLGNVIIGPDQSVFFDDAVVDSEGYIYAVINENANVQECSAHNQATIYCLSDPKVYYFKVEYWAWVD